MSRVEEREEEEDEEEEGEGDEEEGKVGRTVRLRAIGAGT